LARNLEGFEGVMQVLEARNDFEKEIYDSLDLKKYKVDNSNFNFDLLRNELSLIVTAHI
jgi:hypothetical protein